MSGLAVVRFSIQGFFLGRVDILAYAQSLVLQACPPLLSYEAFPQCEHDGIVEGIEQAPEGLLSNEWAILIAIWSLFSVGWDLVL